MREFHGSFLAPTITIPGNATREGRIWFVKQPREPWKVQVINLIQYLIQILSEYVCAIVPR